MDTEEIIPSKSRTFLKIALGVVVVFLIVAGTAFILTSMKNTEKATIESIQTTIDAPKEDLFLKSQIEAMDSVRNQSQTQIATTSMPSIKDQVKRMDVARAKQKFEPTAITRTIEQQMQSMDVLRTQVNK